MEIEISLKTRYEFMDTTNKIRKLKLAFWEIESWIRFLQIIFKQINAVINGTAARKHLSCLIFSLPAKVLDNATKLYIIYTVYYWTHGHVKHISFDR